MEKKDRAKVAQRLHQHGNRILMMEEYANRMLKVHEKGGISFT